MSRSSPEGKLFFRDWFSVFMPRKVLDVGVGEAVYGKIIREVNPSCRLEGVEAFEPSIIQFNLDSIYDKIYNVDIRELVKSPEWTEIMRYDLIILGDVLEHFMMADGIELWNTLKCNADFLWLSLPLEIEGRAWTFRYHQHPREYEKNPWERHKAQWKLHDVQRELGPFLWQAPFKVVGVFCAEGTSCRIKETGEFL